MAVKEVLKKTGKTIKVSQTAAKFAVNSFDLLESANDAKIEEALGDNHLFDKGEVYILIGNLIAKQANGEEGTLLNTGRANLFYTSSFVVSVYWDGSYWSVSTWDRSDDTWSADRRVFSPATEA